MTKISDAVLAAIMDDMVAAARAEILPRFQTLAGDDIRSKTAPDDLVTDADIGAERLLTAALLGRFPAAVVVGEEAVSADPAVLARLADAETAVIIDPVDGTWNFAHGVPVFGTIVAIVMGGKTVAGLVHYPVTGDFITARPGQGAWHIAASGQRTRLAVAAPGPVAAMHGFVPVHMFAPDKQVAFASRVLRFARTMSWRCSAFEYRLLTNGAMSFGINAGIAPWDHAAGVLIHAEAGGFSALLDGTSYRPALTKGQLLLAPDEASWYAVREALLKD